MTELFSSLSDAVQGPAWLALTAAFVWGVLSIMLSPCHLASIPLIVGFVNGQGRITTRRAFAVSALFAGGILVTIAAIGVVTAMAGRMVGDVGPAVYYVVAAVFLLVGLHLLDVLPVSWSAPTRIALKRKGLLAALILGLVFGLALGPCTFAYMAPVLGVTFKLASTNWAYAATVLLVYGIGHCGVIVAAGCLTELVQRYLDWSERTRTASLLRRVCGVLVIMAGLYLIWIAP